MEEEIKKYSKEFAEGSHRFFDFFSLVDYHLQGKRQQYFIFGSFLVVLIAPVFDFILIPRRMSLTLLSTYLFLIYLLVSFLAWVGKFRDENNKWSFKRVKFRVRLSWNLFMAMINDLRKKDSHTNLFIVGVWVFIGGFVIKALQNASQVLRHLFGLKTHFLIKFEHYSHLGYILIVVGLVILLYLHFKYNNRFNLVAIFVNQKIKPHAIQLAISSDLSVINTGDEILISNLTASNPDVVFKNTIAALGKWKPKRSEYEMVYEDQLLQFLSESLVQPGKNGKMQVQSQFRIKSENEVGIIDLAINGSLFIELKRKVSNKGVENATGQILKYRRIAENNNVPIILFFIDNDFNKIRSKVTEFIIDFNKNHSQKLLALVAET